MRENFSKKTITILSKRVSYRCSNPKCTVQTLGPGSDETTTINIGVAAHITAASPGGPRYNNYINSMERKSHTNGIWLCQNCAKLIDNDVVNYTEDVLREWKKNAEICAKKEIGKSNQEKLSSPKIISSTKKDGYIQSHTMSNGKVYTFIRDENNIIIETKITDNNN